MNKLPFIISIIALLIAFGDMPYAYYQLLRFLICGTFAYAVIMLFKNDKASFFYQSLLWTSVALAVIYNPITPIRFSRDTWTIINLLTIPVLVLCSVKMPPKIPQKQ